MRKWFFSHLSQISSSTGLKISRLHGSGWGFDRQMGTLWMQSSQDELVMSDADKAASQEVEQLQGFVDQGLFVAGPQHLGAELEFFLYNENHEPAHAEAFRKITGEDSDLSDSSVEIRFPVKPVVPGSLDEMEAWAHRKIEDLTVRAREHGLVLLLCGSALGADRERHMDGAWIASKERYRAQLNPRLMRHYGGSVTADLQGLSRFHHTSDSIGPFSLNSTYQDHLMRPVDQAMRFLDWWLAAAPPRVRIAFGSPTIGDTFVHPESRFDSWRTYVKPSKFGPGLYLSETEEALADPASAFVNYFRRLIGGPRWVSPPTEPKAGRWHLPQLGVLNGTNWQIACRPCYGWFEEGPTARVESRLFPTGYPRFNSRNFVAGHCCTVGLMQRYGDRLPSELCSYEQAENDFFSAARAWPHLGEAQMVWDGRQMTCRDWWDEIGFEAARVGGLTLGLRSDEIDRRIDDLVERLGKRGTPSERILKFFNGTTGSQRTRWRKTIQFVLDEGRHWK